jgi:hypothetical protein
VLKLYANLGAMTTIQLIRKPFRRIKQYCTFLCTLFTYWLCARLGLKPVAADAQLLPPGCRAIPAGHFNFDPDMVEFFGGKDGLNKAVVWQRFIAWIESNRLAGRNMRGGQAYSWNTYTQWAADIRIFHPKTIQKHVLAFEAMGLLSSQQPNKRDGDCTKHYTSPLRLSDNPEQMLLWSEHKTPRVVAEDSDLLTTHNPATHKRSIRNGKTPATPARPRPSKTAGAVAIFPNHIPDVEPPERKAEIPEQRPPSDEHEQFTAVAPAAFPSVIDGTPTIPGVYPPPPLPRDPLPTGDEPTEEETVSSGNTPEIDVPEWINIFTARDWEIDGWLKIDFDRLQAWCEYAPDHSLGGGYVRMMMRGKQWPPKQTEAQRSYYSGVMNLEAEPGIYLLWVVSDDCDFTDLYKAQARRILEARQEANA